MVREAFGLKKSAVWVGFIFLEIAILAHSIRSLHDANEITNAGGLIFNNHVSPYVFDGHTQGLIRFMNGAVSTYLFYPLHLLLPDRILALVLICANVFGVVLMLTLLAPSTPAYQIFQAVAISLPLAPFRALIASVQHTGLILGSIAIAFHIARNFAQKSSGKTLKVVQSIVPMAFILFSIEMKPQIGLPALIAFLIVNRRIVNYLTALLCLAIPLHASLDVLTKRFLELDWLKAISRQSAHTTLIGEEISPWKLLNTLLNLSVSWFRISFIIYITLIFLVVIYRAKLTQELQILLLISASLITTYVHLYDLILLSAIITLFLVSHKKSPIAFFAYSLFIVPAHHAQTHIYIDLACFVLLLIFTLWISRSNVPSLDQTRLCVGAGALGFTVAESVLRLNMELEAKLSITVLLFEIAMLYLFWSTNRHSYYGKSSTS